MASGTRAAAASSTVTGTRSCCGDRLKVLAPEEDEEEGAGVFSAAVAPGSEQADRASSVVAARARLTPGLSVPAPDLRVLRAMIFPLEVAAEVLVAATIRQQKN